MQRIFLPPKRVSRQHLLSTKVLVGGATCPQNCKGIKVLSQLPPVTSTSVHSYSHKSYERNITGVASSCSHAQKVKGKTTTIGPEDFVGKGSLKREEGPRLDGAYFVPCCNKRNEIFLDTQAQTRVSFSSINGVRAKEEVCTDYTGSQLRLSTSAQNSNTRLLNTPKKRSGSLSLLGASFESLKRFSTAVIQESTHSDNKFIKIIHINTLGTNDQGVHSFSTSARQENPKNDTPDNSNDSQATFSNSEDKNKEKNETNLINKNDNSRLQNAESSDDSNNDNMNDNGQPKKEVNFDEFGAWDNRIDLPIMMDASIKHGAPIPLILASDVGCSSILGKRTYQEDRYLCCCCLHAYISLNYCSCLLSPKKQ